MKAPLSMAPAAPLAFGLAAGILLAANGLAIWAIAAGVTAFAALYAWRKQYAAFAALSIALGAVIACADAPRTLPQGLAGVKNSYSCKIKKIESSAESEKCLATIDSCGGKPISPVTAMVYLRTPSFIVRAGSRVRFVGTLSDISAHSRGPLIPHEVDYDKYLKYQGVQCVAMAPAGQISLVAEPQGLDLVLDDIREAMYAGIVDAPCSTRAKAFLLAAILGDDVFIMQGEMDDYRQTGIAHMLALSGLHVGIIAAMLAWLLLPLNIMRGGRWLRPLCVIAIIWLYAVATGLNDSVARAAAMLTVFSAAQLLQRSGNPYNSLCIAAAAILLFRPFSLFTPGFQMSFAAVFTILLFARLVPSSLRRKPAAYFCAQLVATPLAAVLGTGLLTAYYFHFFPWTFLLANMAVGLVFPWLLGGGIAMMLLTMAGLRLAPLGWAVDTLYALISGTARVISSWHASADGLFFSAWAFLPYAALVVLLWATIRQAIERTLSRKQALAVHAGLIVAVGATVAALALGRERVPAHEMLIPSGLPPAIIIRAGHDARLVAIDAEIDSAAMVDKYNRRFAAYLASRGCDGFRFVGDSAAIGPHFYCRGCLAAGDKLIAIVNSDSLHVIPAKADIAIIGKGFSGHISQVMAAASPDTIIIAPSVPGQRAKRLRREIQECAATPRDTPE